MLFSSKLSKFGKGKNIAAVMNTKDKITIFYFEKGISKKEVNVNSQGLTLNRVNVSLGYNEVIPLDNILLVTRIDKSIGIINNE